MHSHINTVVDGSGRITSATNLDHKDIIQGNPTACNSMYCQELNNVGKQS